MRLLLFRSLWTNGFSLEAALADVGTGLFDGVEGPIPTGPEKHREFVRRLRGAEIPFVAEIATGGGYVARDRSLTRHLDEFRQGLEAAASAAPLFVTALAGSDAWSVPESVDFFGSALEIAKRVGLDVSFETHRSRPTFTPWATAALLRQLPALRLTCDFSHWCCVCERLVLDEEPDLLAAVARRAKHIHARVGYEQGPQVPHPAAPEYRAALDAHERWWDVIAKAREDTGEEWLTMTPEFGPDGYLQAAPFTRRPVANLDEVNRWMAARQRERFALRLPVSAIGGGR